MNKQKESGSTITSLLPLTPFRRRYWATFFVRRSRFFLFILTLLPGYSSQKIKKIGGLVSCDYLISYQLLITSILVGAGLFFNRVEGHERNQD
jgi:hypothetical protein